MSLVCAGHSLGGALAQLAANDIARGAQQQLLRAEITCYTFGSPRVGNHAFAAEYNQVRGSFSRAALLLVLPIHAHGMRICWGIC